MKKASDHMSIMRKLLSKEDLYKFLTEDKKRFLKTGMPTIKDLILHNEKWYIWQYIKALRHVEFYINNNKKCDVRFLYWWYRYKRYGFKTHITIYPNTCEEGIYIPHIGDMIWVKSSTHIGKNLTLRPGVVIGKKEEEKAEDMPVVIGDNCNFGLGVRVFGKLVIGNNVTIGANSVVTKNLPDNAIAVGIPARVIKLKNEK